MIDNVKPTREGMRRFSKKLGYTEDGFNNGLPCTCQIDCHDPCYGSCGCMACLHTAERWRNWVIGKIWSAVD